MRECTRCDSLFEIVEPDETVCAECDTDLYITGRAERMVQAIQDRERALPWRERPTRRETLEALLECHARAVAERDAEKMGASHGR